MSENIVAYVEVEKIAKEEVFVKVGCTGYILREGDSLAVAVSESYLENEIKRKVIELTGDE